MSATRELVIPGFRLLPGRWKGPGVADFPTIDRVEYAEVLRIEWDSGRRVLCYEQQATLVDGKPSHRESGFIRILPEHRVELWNVQDNGRSELLRGSSTWDAAAGELSIELIGAEFGNDPRMLESRRAFVVSEGRLRYEMSMATTTTSEPDLLVHLEADLGR